MLYIRIMKTLIVHPLDYSTDFLSPIYRGIADKKVLRGGYKKITVRKMLDNYERVLMMGHGTPNGLMSVGRFGKTWGYIIDETFINGLNGKSESFFIWCNADKFVRKHKLKGFFSGMFISEVREAEYCGLPDARQEEVDESNEVFAKIVGESINKPIKEMYNDVISSYGILEKSNKVERYNNERLYLK